MSVFLEHDGEAAPGIPAALPASERVLWRGQPDWKVLARSKFHLLKLAVYFAAILVASLVIQLTNGATLAETLAAGAGYSVLAGIALGLVATFAWATARATVFTLTNRRLVVRCGIALPLSMNLPFTKVDSAGLRDLGDGFGNIALTPAPDSRASYILLWPYVRPWKLSRVQPMLRAIPDAAYVADQLGKALEADTIERAARPPAPEVVVEKPKVESGRRGFKPYPTIPLATAVGLVAITVLSTAIVSFTGNKPEPLQPSDVVAAVDLRFEDLDDGSINVIDDANDAVLETLEPGENGFLRSTLRGLARARMTTGAGADVAFSLQRTAEGQLLLTDPVTARSVDLWAFGSANAKSFLHYLGDPAESGAEGSKPMADESGESSVTTAALNQQELAQ